MSASQHSIAKVVALVLVTTSTAVLGVFAALEYSRDKTERIAQLREDAAGLAAQLAVSLELPVWNFDHAQIDRIVDSSMRNAAVRGIEVRFATEGSSRHVRARSTDWQNQVSDKVPAVRGDWSEDRDIIAEDRSIGNVRVVVTPQFIEGAAAQTFEWTLAAIAMLDVLLIVGLYLLLNALVLRPLARLEGHALALSSGSGQIEAIGALRFRGEIESLRRSVTTMMLQLRSQYAELMRGEQRFRLLVDGVRDYAIAMLDRDGNVTTWNAGACRMTGYEADEIVGQSAAKFFAAQEPGGGMAEYLPRARTQGRAEWEGWHLRRDGTQFWGDTILTALHEGTELVGFAMIARDLTAQQQMTEFRDRLEAQLRQAQKMQAIGTLSGGIAHDFNNILAAIRGYALVELEDQGLSPALQESLCQIQRAVDRGAALVRRLMAFARPQQPRLATVSLGAVVEEVASMLRATFPAMISVSTRVMPDVKPAQVDESLVHQVLLNLGTNAAHAIGAGPGQIHISLSVPDRQEAIANDMEPDGCVCLAVGDTGSGMDAAIVERIFDPFFTTRSREGGTGLGLSVVQGIVASHGGKVLVQSEVGAGTTFRILLHVGSA
ncbi:MAG: ATP-binding protein, partial [Steroidobacteraceae bacterium]